LTRLDAILDHKLPLARESLVVAIAPVGSLTTV
jgi:hypothetical protein